MTFLGPPTKVTFSTLNPLCSVKVNFMETENPPPTLENIVTFFYYYGNGKARKAPVGGFIFHLQHYWNTAQVANKHSQFQHDYS